MKIVRFLKHPTVGLSVNIAYGIYNVVIGFYSHSWWFITLCAYYIILSVMRFALIKADKSQNAPFIKRFTGILLMLLGFVLGGAVYLSVVKDRGIKYHEIVMITIALYAFTKITLAIINTVKSRCDDSFIVKSLRTVLLADAAVSIFALQRSMLVSFEGMSEGEIKLFNALTGSAVCITVYILGLNLIGGRRIEMAKSKIVKANEKIAETVVGGYKKIENAVVGGYTKIEDKFVDRFLTRDGETVEQAKERLKKGE